MPKYDVLVFSESILSDLANIVVEADSEEEAREKAQAMLDAGGGGRVCRYSSPTLASPENRA
jgi:hypothetical protein